MDDALANLADDLVLTGAMKDLMRRSFLAVRHSEEEAFRAKGESYEIANHFYKY
jgi:glutamine synthetase